MPEVDEKLNVEESRGDSGYDKRLGVAALLSFMIGFLLMPLALYLLVGELKGGLMLLLSSGPLVGTLLLLAAVYSYSGGFREMLENLQIRSITPRFLLGALSLSLLITIAGAMLTFYWQKFAHYCGWSFDVPTTEAIALNGSDAQVGVLVISALLLAPFYEEILFRKALFEFVRSRCGFVAGLLVAPLIFALVHTSLLQLPGLFFMALIWQILYLWTGNLSVTVILHMGNNLVAVAGLLASRYLG